MKKTKKTNKSIKGIEIKKENIEDNASVISDELLIQKGFKKTKPREIIKSPEASLPHEDIFKDNETPRAISNSFLWVIFVAIVLLNIFFLVDNKKSVDNFSNQLISVPKNNESKIKNSEFSVNTIKKFTSEQEFKEYLENAPQNTSMYGGSFGTINEIQFADAEMKTSDGIGSRDLSAPTMAGLSESVSVDRVSQTNTQVLSIDEPDIIKTDGKNIYFSSNQYSTMRTSPMIIEDIAISSEEYIEPIYSSGIRVINALPIADLEVISNINKTGEMFLSKNILVIFNGRNIYGYDISDPKSPEQKWDISLDEGYVVQSRMYNDKVYLLISNSINEFSPCPIRPLSISGNKINIECTDIYHPEVAIDTDSTFVAMRINPQDGSVEDKISFIGSNNNSIVYMSENNLYVTYNYSSDTVKFFYNFINEKARDIFPASVIAKIEKLMTYDISQNTKFMEFTNLLVKYYSSLNTDDRLKMQSEMSNRMDDYYKEHMRELEQTGIIKIALDKFQVSSAGSVPGRVLNQFALDEYNKNLRIATTIGNSSQFAFGGMNGESLNDVYILDENLNKLSSIQDLGKSERIYAVRFIGNKGYVVTFRQTDPFYVLDLSNPKNPQLKGELKIPGYSSYLHPLSDNIILGIGKEGNSVKLSMFDVSNPSYPKEIDKYTLDEYWTEIQNNHRAFLLDKENKLFFIPGSKGAYLFNYTESKLSMSRAVSGSSIRRAIYINNYLYIISDRGITVISEDDLQDVKRMNF